jgi:hypothetical protein
MTVNRPTIGKALFEAGLFDAFRATMERFNPVERVGRGNLIPTAIFIGSFGASDRNEQRRFPI